MLGSMTTFTYPQKLTPAQFAALKASLVSQKANIIGPDTGLTIKGFHNVDFLANFTAATGSLSISIVKKHGLSDLATDEDIQKKVTDAISEALIPPKAV
jgi:hypothetical protein